MKITRSKNHQTGTDLYYAYVLTKQILDCIIKFHPPFESVVHKISSPQKMSEVKRQKSSQDHRSRTTF